MMVREGIYGSIRFLYKCIIPTQKNLGVMKMPRRTPEHFAQVARQTRENSDMRIRYREYLERHGYEHSEQNANFFALTLGLSADARVNLVHQLMSGI